MGNEEREALAEAYARWAEAPFEPAYWQRENGRQLADALLPVVDAIARRRAAEAVERAALAIESQRPHIPPSTDPDRRTAVIVRSTLNRAARAVRADALDSQ